MRIIHISDGWERTSGVATVARLIAGEQAKAGASVEFRRWATVRELKAADEVWIHCAWKPCLWWASLWARKPMRMPHGSYDPVRLGYHGWKKRIVGPIERFFLRREGKVLGTCAAEAEWVKAYEPRVKAVEVLDLKRYFGLGEGVGDGEGVGGGEGVGEGDARRVGNEGGVNVLYLGRRHPLKGVKYLEQAVLMCNQALSQSKQANSPTVQQSNNLSIGQLVNSKIQLRLVSDHRGEELERDWAWCDVLCLPTLSENFGLVVAEALTRGKRVIVTDGAPAWEPEGGGRLGDCSDCSIVRIVREELGDCSDCSIAVAYGGRLLYVKGYRDGDDETRVRLLARALSVFV